MIKTALFFLCAVVILVSGTADVTSTSVSPVPPISTTTNPISTTVPTSTSSSPPPTSTLVPTTTSGPSPAPEPTPDPATGEWTVNGTQHICIRARMAVQFVISYNTSEHKVANKSLNLPANATVQGTCNTEADTAQTITLIWSSTHAEATNNLTLHFVKNITQARYALHHLEVNFAHEEFPSILSNTTNFVHEIDEFPTKLNNSYRCLKSQTLKLTSKYNETTGEIKVSNLQLQAFQDQNTSSFGFAEDCAFDTPDIVPIAVGCALATLVVIVLVAYLVGRRRNQGRGYLSM